MPQQTLRRIDPLDERGLATTSPTTEPTTRPAPLGAVEVPLTLERVRQLTLQNNLDLKVDLLTPTISKQNLSAEEARNALDVSETNQRVLLHRARSKVRAALERYFESEMAAV